MTPVTATPSRRRPLPLEDGEGQGERVDDDPVGEGFTHPIAPPETP